VLIDIVPKVPPELLLEDPPLLEELLEELLLLDEPPLLLEELLLLDELPPLLLEELLLLDELPPLLLEELLEEPSPAPVRVAVATLVPPQPANRLNAARAMLRRSISLIPIGCRFIASRQLMTSAHSLSNRVRAAICTQNATNRGFWTLRNLAG
jgi:hypothetical protein